MVLLNIIEWAKVDLFDDVCNEAMLVLVFYVFSNNVSCFSLLAKLVVGKVHFVIFPVTVMVLLNIILTSRSLAWSF